MKEDLDNHEESRSKKQKVDDREKKTIRQAVNKMKQNLDQVLNPNYLKVAKESSLYDRINKESPITRGHIFTSEEEEKLINYIQTHEREDP